MSWDKFAAVVTVRQKAHNCGKLKSLHLIRVRTFKNIYKWGNIFAQYSTLRNHERWPKKQIAIVCIAVTANIIRVGSEKVVATLQATWIPREHRVCSSSIF